VVAVEINPLLFSTTAAGCVAVGYWLGKHRRLPFADSALRDVVVVNGREVAEKILRKYLRQRVGNAPGAIRGRGTTRIVLTANFLTDCYRLLMSTVEPGRFRESFVYATGATVGRDSFAASELVEVAFSEQTAGHVRVLDSSNIRTLAELDARGTPLVAHFHSHPGRGETANYPSATDLAFQERLERAGHVAIGGIFARGDGVAHVRFFAGPQRKFLVTVQGKCAKEISKNVFELHMADGQIHR
jgi:hypothetical protein